MIVCVAAPLILLVRKPWVLTVGPCLLTVAGAIWTYILIDLVQVRMALGTPWLRLAVILSSVAILTFASAFIFRTRRFKKRYCKVTTLDQELQTPI
jgi:hypothetical protein